MELVKNSTKVTELTAASKQARDEIFHLRFWEYQYARRHIKIHYYQEVNQLKDAFKRIIHRLDPSHSPDLPEDFINLFAYNLIKAWHLTFINDGLPTDDLLEVLYAYKAINASLPFEESSVIERLHELSYKTGFPVLELCSPPDFQPRKIIERFRYEDPQEIFRLESHPRLFYKKGPTVPGIYVSYAPQKAINIDDEWDLEIFADFNDKPYHISTELKQKWDLNGRQIIGDKDKARIGFFIDRKVSNKRTFVDKFVTLEIKEYSLFCAREDGIFLTPIDEGSLSSNELMDHYRTLVSMVNHSRISQGLTHRRWSLKQGNIRRTVGLYLWDETTQHELSDKSKSALIEQLIDHLLPNDLLSLYHPKYNLPDRGYEYSRDKASTREAVIREMYVDFELAEKCISECEYYQPIHTRK